MPFALQLLKLSLAQCLPPKPSVWRTLCGGRGNNSKVFLSQHVFALSKVIPTSLSRAHSTITQLEGQQRDAPTEMANKENEHNKTSENSQDHNNEQQQDNQGSTSEDKTNYNSNGQQDRKNHKKNGKNFHQAFREDFAKFISDPQHVSAIAATATAIAALCSAVAAQQSNEAAENSFKFNQVSLSNEMYQEYTRMNKEITILMNLKKEFYEYRERKNTPGTMAVKIRAKEKDEFVHMELTGELRKEFQKWYHDTVYSGTPKRRSTRRQSESLITILKD